ncbi:MAG: sugar nucleotide-binding protein [Lachnospiraceae bacterium]|nr:sugar nucleotide-binding protein [Lachnospiraceae bacterium]
MKSLVGYTGFVGGNISAAGSFEGRYNSKNIEEAFGTNPELLIYAGITAEKFIANKFPEQDLEIIQNAEKNIQKIHPERLVLISTIDVYEDSFHADEETPALGQGVYGQHRSLLENWVKENIEDYLIVRLPALFGKGIKKNFIYDYIKYIPALLNEEKFGQLSAKRPELKNYYSLNDKGFYACKALEEEERKVLKNVFKELGFSALNFTDSRAVYQFYNLANLYSDIQKALEKKIKVLNITTEPLRSSDVYQYLTGEIFENEITDQPAVYDARTRYFKELGGFVAEDGNGGYLYKKEEVLKEIKEFTIEEN